MKTAILFISLLFTPLCLGQATFDCFGGLLTYADGTTAPVGAGGPNAQTATCSQTTTTVTCTVTNGAKYAIAEPMGFTGSGTAMDWSASVCNSHRAQSQAGGWLITNVVGNTLTLSSPTSQTVASHSGTIKPMRWYVGTSGSVVRLFDPLDHWLFGQQVVQATDAAIAKYGSNACNTAQDEVIAWNTLGNGSGLGYNATGQANTTDDFYDGGACPSNNRVPFTIENFISSYYSDNLTQGSFSGVSQPGKDMNYGTNANYVSQGISRASMDFFDPRFEQYAQGWLGGSNGFPNFRKSAWMVGADHQDSGVGGAAPTNTGWQFNTAPTAKNDSHQGLLVLATSPWQTGSANVLYGANNPFGYPDGKVYMKDSASFNLYGASTTGTPPVACNPLVIATICSLQDYFTVEYGTIGALNTAWSRSYTTFGTSGTQVTGEVFGTGNGVLTSFTHTFAHANVSPLSIRISVNGTPLGFDCPAFATSCPAAGAGKGTMTKYNGGTITGGTITYATATSVTLTSSAAVPNGQNITVDYVFGGWGASTPGTGLLDEDGTNIGANGVCPFLPPVFINSHGYSVGDEISVSGSWQYVTTAGTSQGAGTPSWSSTTGTTTTSGAAVFTSLGAPVCGAGGTYAGTMPNATMGADMEAFVEHVAAAYMSALKTAENTVAPDLLNWGPDQIGVWQSPPNANVLKAANQYVDVAMGDLWDASQDGAGPAKYDFFTTYFTGPISNYQAPVTSQDAFTCNGNFPCFTTQQLKGQWWYTLTNYWLTQVGHDGLKHGAVMQWTSNIDGLQSSSFGFEDATYNPINGHDDVTGSVSCLFNAFTCGGAASGSWNGSDSITHAGCGSCIADATKLWVVNPALPVVFDGFQNGSVSGGSVH